MEAERALLKKIVLSAAIKGKDNAQKVAEDLIETIWLAKLNDLAIAGVGHTFTCKKCKANYKSAEEALECVAKPAKPKYSFDERVIHEGSVVRITEIRIVPVMHSFIYRFMMHTEDNPPSTILSGCGWRDEERLSPYSAQQE